MPMRTLHFVYQTVVEQTGELCRTVGPQPRSTLRTMERPQMSVYVARRGGLHYCEYEEPLQGRIGCYLRGLGQLQIMNAP